MDFELGEDARELRDLAAGLLEREVNTSRPREHETSGTPYDAELWRASPAPACSEPACPRTPAVPDWARSSWR